MRAEAFSDSRGRSRVFRGRYVLLLGLLVLPFASGQSDPTAPNCISLAASQMCPAFKTSQVSLAKYEKFPFLRFVNNTEQFDVEFERYIRTDYPVTKFKDVFGCQFNNFSNTTHLYAQYTRSQLCSAMIQESIEDCQLRPEDSKPLCLESCSQWASSEWLIVSDKGTCGDVKKDYTSIIKSDFAICTNPENSLKKGMCINAALNGEYNCGFNENLPGLCLYCQGGTDNSTETCCYNAKVEERCIGVELPSISDIPDGLIPTATATPSSDPQASQGGSGKGNNGFSGGAIAGVVIGAVVAAVLIAFLILFWRRRRHQEAHALYLNRPSPRRSSPDRNNYPAGAAPQTPQQSYEGAGGRIARMSALESRNPLQLIRMLHPSRSEKELRIVAKYTPDNRPLHPPPRDRNASLSSTSILVSDKNNSDSEKEDGSQVVGSPLSEQLPYFKDYYSKDDIHPNDKVSVLWAYSPRAADEFELERGDMLRVIGIWDDGWATGVRLSERAEDYIRLRTQRDSGVSASQGSRISTRPPTPPGDREIKAFPLVCVCLPEHWQKTIDNEGMDYTSTHTTEGQLSDPESARGKRIQKEPSSRFHEDMNPQDGPP
ncbi:hypothetical protein BDZ91DRAFT_663429 [Kalaharituber pfeilii]|nr:hypothetical protein BDZ91DRAFT_663429 [Kalaharituber pfeilii]